MNTFHLSNSFKALFSESEWGVRWGGGVHFRPDININMIQFGFGLVVLNKEKVVLNTLQEKTDKK